MVEILYRAYLIRSLVPQWKSMGSWVGGIFESVYHTRWCYELGLRQIPFRES